MQQGYGRPSYIHLFLFSFSVTIDIVISFISVIANKRVMCECDLIFLYFYFLGCFYRAHVCFVLIYIYLRIGVTYISLSPPPPPPPPFFRQWQDQHCVCISSGCGFLGMGGSDLVGCRSCAFAFPRDLRDGANFVRGRGWARRGWDLGKINSVFPISLSYLGGVGGRARKRERKNVFT